MRLLHIEMDGFRYYAHRSEVEMKPGVNVFCGSNESGKSALMQAVQYSLFLPRTEQDRLASVAEGCDQSRVALVYELPDGQRFRVERDLVAHRHSLSRWKGREWQQVSTQLTDIAQAMRGHTGCDQALFERTLLMRHEDVEVPPSEDLTGALSTRLEVLVGGSGKVTAVKAAGKLAKRLQTLTGPRAGEIVRAEWSLDQARDRLAQARQKVLDLAMTRAELDELGKRIFSLDEEAKQTKDMLGRHGRISELEKDRDDKRSEREALDRALDAREEARRLEAELADLERERPAGRPALEAPGWWPASVAVGTVIAVASLVAAIVLHPLAGVGVVMGLGLLWLGWSHRGPGHFVDPRVAAFDERRSDLDRRAAGARAVARELSAKDDTALKSRRSSLGRDLDELESRIEHEAIYRLPPPELERLAARERDLPEELLRARERRAVLEDRLKSAAEAAGQVPELEDEVGVREARVSALRMMAEATKVAHDELEASIEDVRAGVGPRIAQVATRHLQAVVPGYAVNLTQGKGLTFLPTWADGREFGRKALSDGTGDQFYFAVRVALAEVLLGDLRPPLILDDPFRYCDPERRAALHGLLRILGEDRQILYFTIEDPDGLEITHRMPLTAGAAIDIGDAEHAQA